MNVDLSNIPKHPSLLHYATVEKLKFPFTHERLSFFPTNKVGNDLIIDYSGERLALFPFEGKEKWRRCLFSGRIL
jgi:hypothetical protein